MPDRFFIPPAPRATVSEGLVYVALMLLMAAALMPLPSDRFAPGPLVAAVATEAHACAEGAPRTLCAGVAVQAPDRIPAAALRMARMFAP